MFATSTLTFAPLSLSKFQRYFREIPKCEKCLYFLPKEMNLNGYDQCKKFGFISDNKTNEVSYDDINKQRSIGPCGPMGSYFEIRRKNTMWNIKN